MLKIEYRDGSIIIIESNSEIILHNSQEIDLFVRKAKSNIEASENEDDLRHNIMFLDLLQNARNKFLESSFKKPCYF